MTSPLLVASGWGGVSSCFPMPSVEASYPGPSANLSKSEMPGTSSRESIPHKEHLISWLIFAATAL